MKVKKDSMNNMCNNIKKFPKGNLYTIRELTRSNQIHKILEEAKMADIENATPHVKNDTEALGMSKDRKIDLVGHIINAKEVEEAVAREWTLLGINVKEDLRCVKTAVDGNGKAHIISEVKASALKGIKSATAKKRNCFDIVDSEDDGDDGISPVVYDALRNKAFHGKNSNLEWKKVERKDKKYIRIEFAADIFIAFAFNINFEDKFYRLSAVAERWTSRDELEDLSGSATKAILRSESELKSEGLRPATLYVTYRPDRYFQMNDGTRVNGFHPQEVVKFYEYEDHEGKKKKNK